MGLESRHATVRSQIQGLSEVRIMGEWKATTLPFARWQFAPTRPRTSFNTTAVRS